MVVQQIADLVRSRAGRPEFESVGIPESFRALTIRREDEDHFAGADPDADLDITETLRVEEVATPEIGADEVLVAVMASAINYNTVWSATFSPVSPFRFLEAFGRASSEGVRHDLPFQVLGTDASGVVLAAGSAVKRWEPGDHVVVAPIHSDFEDPDSHGDLMEGGSQRAWGYETNWGGLAELCVAKATQLLPKAEHLSWTEAAVNTGCNSTSYRMLVSDRGALMRQGEIVVVWGASGGLGSYGVQTVKNGGGLAIAVVSNEKRAKAAERLGADLVIDRREHLAADGSLDWRSFGREIRGRFGEDPHISFDHTGKDTFEASVKVLRRGGRIVTCGSSSGFDHPYDNRQVWMKVKRVIGSHGANYHESWESNRLVKLGQIVPTLSHTYDLASAPTAARAVQLNEHLGKVAIRCLAEGDDDGVTDEARRAEVGEERLRLFRDLS